MESVRLSFGKRGSVLFSVANMLQLAWLDGGDDLRRMATVSSALGKVLWDGESFVLVGIGKQRADCAVAGFRRTQNRRAGKLFRCC